MKILFVRYGGLSSVPQDGYDPAMPGPHSPPARRGVYAMPQQAIASCMVVSNFSPGAQSGFDSRRMEWVRDADGNRMLADSEEGRRRLPRRQGTGIKYICCSDAPSAPAYLVRLKKPKVFEHNGELWHHLPVPRHEIICERGRWFLTSIQAYKKAYQTAYNKLRHEYGGKISKASFDDDLFQRFEVFIEKV